MVANSRDTSSEKSWWESIVESFSSLSDCCQEDVAKQKHATAAASSSSSSKKHYNRGEHREIERARSKARLNSSPVSGGTRKQRRKKSRSFSSSLDSAELPLSNVSEEAAKDQSERSTPYFPPENTQERPHPSKFSTMFRSLSKKHQSKKVGLSESELGEPDGVKWNELVKLMPVNDEYDADFLAVRLQAFTQDELATRTIHTRNSIIAYAVMHNDAMSITKILRRLDSFPEIQRDLITEKNAMGLSALDLVHKIAKTKKSPLAIILAFRTVPGLETVGSV